MAKRHGFWNRLLTAVAAGWLVAGLACADILPRAAAAAWQPQEQLNWTIAFGPGGGNDILARTIIRILEANGWYPHPIVAVNRVGGSGSVGWGYVYRQRGNPYHITTTSGSFITVPLQARTDWDPLSFTPVALLATDDLLFLVRGDSPIRTLQDFIRTARQQRVTVGGIGTIQVDFIVPRLLAREEGFDFVYVPFNEQGQLVAALMSGSLTLIVSNPAEVLGLVQSGELRALAYSGVSAPEALRGIPTLRELGYDIRVSLPRGVVLPPDVPAEAQQWWIETIRKVVGTQEWASYIERQILTQNVLYGEDFRDFLRQTTESFRRILTEEGVLR